MVCVCCAVHVGVCVGVRVGVMSESVSEVRLCAHTNIAAAVFRMRCVQQPRGRGGTREQGIAVAE